MKKMARIEAILFLREVELFHFCTSDEIFRIAAIAREQRFKAGETIYDIKDSARKLYCVVKGKVTLSDHEGNHEEITSGREFGYLEILSGRRRDKRAVAETETLALVIDEEDFFDLLSNNIDIVKSLFRHMGQLCLEIEQRSAAT